MALDQDVVSTTESIDTAAAGRPVQVVGDTPAPPTSTGLVDLTDSATGSPMQVRKRDGSLEPVDLNKIVRAVARCAVGLDNVDPMRVATRTISGLVDHSSTEELDELSIRTAAALISEEPNYSRLAARLLATVIDKEVQNQDIYSFSQSVAMGHAQGIIGDETAAMVATNARKLNDAVLADRNWLYEFFGLRTVYDRYLLHPTPEMRIDALALEQQLAFAFAGGDCSERISAILAEEKAQPSTWDPTYFAHHLFIESWVTHLASLPLGGRPLDADPRSLERLLTHPPSPEVLAYRHQILAELVESPEARKDLIEIHRELRRLRGLFLRAPPEGLYEGIRRRIEVLDAIKTSLARMARSFYGSKSGLDGLRTLVA
ncbi:MAG TPA: ATP cone domain-containing protein, partial [Microthrixaceae bacterium]|nr:ATP cone domain-containing protein [Microthrixaceae bacterium]